MKKMIVVFLLLSNIYASDIIVNVKNILNTHGILYIGLYNKNDDSFSKISQYYKSAILEVNNKSQIEYIFKDISNGTYGISVFVDKNGNNKLDKNFFGIPTEQYGFSNNVKPPFRGANFEEAKFIVNGNKYINIKL